MKVFVLMFISFSAAAYDGGNWVGNGGDSLAMSIYNRAVELKRALADLQPTCKASLKFSVQQFDEVFKPKLNVETTPDKLNLVVDGKVIYKEAINYPDRHWVVFNRDDYNSSPNKDQLIVHEMMGLARIDDPNGTESERVAQALVNPDCQGGGAAPAAAAALQNGEIPIASQIDGKGIVYFQVDGQKQIYRYSVMAHQYLAPLLTRDTPLTFAVAASANRVYIAYPGRRITMIDLSHPDTEFDFVTADFTGEAWDSESDKKVLEALEITKIVACGQTLLVEPEPKNSWSRVAYYNILGKKTGDTTWVSPESDIAAAPNGGGFYFVEEMTFRFLPYYLFGKDAPLHTVGDDFDRNTVGRRLHGPLAVSPVFVAVGSGVIVRQADRSFVANLSETFTSGTWVKSTFYAGQKVNQGFVIHGFSAPKFARSFERVFDSGSLIALHAYGEHAFVVWATDDGDVRIDDLAK